MLRNDHLENQNDNLKYDLQTFESDKIEIMMLIEEWYGKVAALDRSHQNNMDEFDRKKRFASESEFKSYNKVLLNDKGNLSIVTTDESVLEDLREAEEIKNEVSTFGEDDEHKDKIGTSSEKEMFVDVKTDLEGGVVTKGECSLEEGSLEASTKYGGWIPADHEAFSKVLQE